MSPTLRLALFATLWLAWALAFLLRSRGQTRTAVKKDNRALWGILLEAFGFWTVFAHRPATWNSPVAGWRVLLALVTALPSIWLVWTAVAHLGRQWRVEAGLNADHELIRSGPYRLVRHPIYASMLGMLLMAVALIGTLPGAPVGIALFLLGTEIRVRVEDNLLASRFGDVFRAWQKSVPAYIPLIR